MKGTNDLGREGIPRLVWRIALPSMLAQFVSVLYSLVDRMYIGHIPGVGEQALAGVGVCGPAVTLVGSAAAWVAWGGSPLMGIRLGEGRREEAQGILYHCVVLLGAFAVALMAVILPLREPMLRFFGASNATYPYADAYFTAYMSGTLFALMASGLNQLIIAQGFAGTGMKLVVLGAVLNIALDPLFIFGLNGGVQGAAIATVISQGATALGAAAFLLRGRATVPIRREKISAGVVKRILTLGLTPFIIIAVDNVMIIAMNAVLQRFGGPEMGDRWVTCGVIAQSFMLMVTLPLGGISGGTQCILSYNYGARQDGRVREAQRLIFGLCAGFTGVMCLLAQLAGGLFVGLFTQDAQVAELSQWAIRVSTLALIPLGLQYAVVDGFTALGQVRLSFALSFFRKLTYFTALFALPTLWGAQAAFYAEPVSDVLGPLASVLVHRLTMGKVLARRRLQA